MSKIRIVLLSILATVLVGGLGAVVVITALRQNTTQPVAPTVPQVTPRASEPTTTAACTAKFTVAEKTHKECKNNACSVVTGPGTDSCTGDSDCAPATYSYKTCENNACVSKDCSPKTSPCPSQNTCNSDTDCKTYTYRVCENNACVTKSCVPSNKPCDQLISCQTNFDCRAITYKHSVCLGTACTSVDCSPSTQPCDSICKNNVDCGATVTQTHKDCRNNACVVVTGAGADGCTSDVSCRPAAAPPPIPPSGNTSATITGLVLGVGALLVGLLLAL